MKVGSVRASVGVVVSAFVWLTAVLAAGGQAPPERQPMAEEVFKNIRVLRGLPVDEFMGTMGVFSAALGMSCEDCHSASDTTWDNYALDTSPQESHGAADGADDGVHQPDQLRRPPGGDVLHVPSRQRPAQGHAQPHGVVRRLDARRPGRHRPRRENGTDGRSDPRQIHSGHRRRAAPGRPDQRRGQGDERRLRSGRARVRSRSSPRRPDSGPRPFTRSTATTRRCTTAGPAGSRRRTNRSPCSG